MFYIHSLAVRFCDRLLVCLLTKIVLLFSYYDFRISSIFVIALKIHDSFTAVFLN